MKSSLLLKRQKFHAQIRAQYLEGYMKKIRYEVLKNQETQAVNDLIDRSQSQISETDFQKLMFWANEKDENNAIIHLGNLLIQGAVQQQWLVQEFQLRPKSSQYWVWLMKVIIFLNQQQQSSQQQPTPKYQTWQYNCFDYSLQLLSTQLPAFSLEQCLNIIKLLLEKYLPTIGQSIFTTYKAALFSIKQHCLSVQKNISNLCYEIIDMIVQAGDQHTRKLVDLYTVGQVSHLMVLGLGKFDATQKKFPLIACRTVNNIFSTGMMLTETVIKTCIKVSYNEKNTDKTKLQLSYLWQSFVENCPSVEILEHYYDEILHIIEHIFTSGVKKQQCMAGIKQNFRKLIEMMLNNAHEFSDIKLMDVNYKGNILLKHYVHRCSQEDMIKEEVQTIDLNQLRQYYRQKGIQHSHESQLHSYQKNMNNSRNTTITELQMELQN